MTVSEDVLVETLCNENPRFRKLYEEHQLLEKQLNEMDQKPFLTADEELERKKVQKLKLSGKDEMEDILRNCRS
jgi:uncharacterized protein YdcH (DUF465 family)